jgi:hypothetical protein
VSIRVLNWVLHKAPVTTHTDLVVLLVIADRASDDGDGVWYSIAKIAEIARLSPRAVRNCLERLDSTGLIATERRPGRTSRYRILAPRGEARRAAVGEARRAGGVARGATHLGTSCTQSVKEPLPIHEGDRFSDYDRGIIDCEEDS